MHEVVEKSDRKSAPPPPPPPTLYGLPPLTETATLLVLPTYPMALWDIDLEGDVHLEVDPEIPPVQIPLRSMPIALYEIEWEVN